MALQISPSTPGAEPRPRALLRQAWRLTPGLALCAGLALGASLLAHALGDPAMLSPMVIAMLAGMALRNLTVLPAGLSPGIAFGMRPLLRLGIVLLGFRLTFGDLEAVGAAGLLLIAGALFATFMATKALGRLLGVDAKLAELIAAGSSICGASAVLGVNTVTRGRDEDVAYAIACVTIFGSLSMLIYPALGPVLGFDPAQYGLWTGASLHEVAQAVGAGFAQGETAGQAATVAKLSRVALLAPLILGLGFLRARQGGEGAAKAPMPWFVFGFLGAVALNSVLEIPGEATAALSQGSGFLLALALAAMGLETRLAHLRLKGLRPLALGALAWIFISAVTAAGVLVIG